MKKFLGISLAFCLALTACNNSPTESNKQNEATSTESSTSTLPPSSEKKPIEAAADEKVSSKDTLIVAFDREPATLDPLGNNVDVKRMIEGSIFVLWSSIFVTLVAKKYHESVTLPSGLRMVYDNH